MRLASRATPVPWSRPLRLGSGLGGAAPVTLAVLALLRAGAGHAQPRSEPKPPSSQPSSAPRPTRSQPSSTETKPPTTTPNRGFETRVLGHRPIQGPTPGRSSTRTRREEIEQRLPRSAPDALRYEPGVYVQQTGHAQGSAYIRGRTGQQTAILFDGIRLNNSTFRQGPNQYFFTIDSRTIESIEVLRGGASTLHGSDAIGGVIDARPLEPRLDPTERKLRLHPGLMLRYATADQEIGGRVQLDAQLLPRLALLGGVGYRRAGLLRSGGPITSPVTGETPEVPRFEADGVTQLGTGFKELAWDTRIVLDLGAAGRLTAAAYDYRQLDAPRTDLCPPPHATRDSCLTYEEQFRTLAYLRLDSGRGRLARAVKLGVSYQNQHERRSYARPSSYTENGGRDDVHTIGATARLETDRFRPLRALSVGLRYGGDLYHDWLRSQAWTELTDMKQTVHASRGQYLDGASYTWGGLYLQLELRIVDRLTIRGGGRFAGAEARAPADPESGSREVDQRWLTGVGQIGAELELLRGLSLLTSLDRSFRAPNLDDLTSRQQTGPGFQFENSALHPETALTLELGLRLDRGPVQLAAWGAWAFLDDGIERSPRSVSECPTQTPQCNASWNRFQLVNLRGAAMIQSVEGMARLFLPLGLSARATIAYAKGEGPDPRSGARGLLPLSRIPPLNGTLEALWKHRLGIYAGLGVRWALEQTRLSLGDQSDARIPAGGTPGFAVLDLRAGFRLRKNLLVALVVENLFDAAYRYHGSSVNGPGRGLALSLEGNL
jgi:iron complex outermembrane receptor protein/hemoglobin/transferrin/lactoferrin receptor protein